MCAGSLAAVALPGSRVGLGMALVAAAVAGAVPGRRLRPLALHGAPALLALGLAAMAAVARRAVADRARPHGRRGAGLAGRGRSEVVADDGLRALLWTPRLASAPAPGRGPPASSRAPPPAAHAAPIARGLALGSVLVLVFGALFASADAAFAESPTACSHPTSSSACCPAARPPSWCSRSAGPRWRWRSCPACGEGEAARGKSPADWLVALSLLDLLFAVFMSCSSPSCSAGTTTCSTRPASATPSTPARAFSSCSSSPSSPSRWSRSPAGDGASARRGDQPVELLLGLLCALTLVIVVSALRRLGLYEDAYGFTVTRLLGHAARLWVGAVLVLVVVAGALGRSGWLPRTVLLITARAARTQPAQPRGAGRGAQRRPLRAHGQGRPAYLAGLGPDAAPALRRLPFPENACVLRPIASDVRDADGPFELNLARGRARRAVEGLPAGRACEP